MNKKLTTKTDAREKVAVYLDHDQIRELRALQERDGVPIAEQVRRGVRLWLELKSVSSVINKGQKR